MCDALDAEIDLGYGCEHRERVSDAALLAEFALDFVSWVEGIEEVVLRVSCGLRARTRASCHLAGGARPRLRARARRLLLATTTEFHIFFDVRHPAPGESISKRREKRDCGERVHMLVHVERVGLLRKVVCAHRTTHLCRLVLWLPEKPFVEIKSIGRWQRTRTQQSRIHQKPAHRARDPLGAGFHRHQACVAASFFRLLWSVLTSQCLAVHGETCESRGVQKHCSTRVPIRREWPELTKGKHTGDRPHLGSARTALAVRLWVQSLKGPEKDRGHVFGVDYVS